MKSIIIYLLLVMPLFALAQNEGSVTYTETIQLNIEMPDMDEEMLAMIPKSQSATRVLYFNPSESLFTDPPKDETTAAEGMNWNGTSPEGAQVHIVMRQPDNRYYLNFDEQKRIEQREFMGKVFLVTDQLPEYQWKITGEQKELLGYTLMQAVHQDSSKKIVAWFCPQIPVSGGPDAFTQLPGLVLEVDVNDGERQIVAKEVKLEPLPANVIEKPTKGKTVSKAEFEAIVAEKMKEMEAEYGGSGSGGVRIMIRN